MCLKRFTEYLIILCLFSTLTSLTITTANAQFIEQPSVSNVQVNACWATNGEKNIDILNAQNIAINLTQLSTVRSSASIYINNYYYGVEILDPGETKTIYYTVTNYGTHEQTNNVDFVVKANEMWGGTETSRDKVSCNFLVNLASGTTTLKIHVQDNYNKPVIGLQVAVLFPASTLEEEIKEYTDSKGDITLNLETDSGGAFDGQIIVKNDETDVYEATSLTRYVNFGQNEIPIDVVSKIEPTESPNVFNLDWQILIAIIALIGFFVFLGFIATVYFKKNKKHINPQS